MKIVTPIFLLLGVFACSQGNKNHETINKEINSIDNRTECLVPAEIKSYIDSNTIFIYALISCHKVDYLANNLYKLNTPNNFKRISNTKLPDTDEAFESKPKMYDTTVPENNVKDFRNYLELLDKSKLESWYKTPEDISVSGGVNTFIFYRTSNSEKWICFEPESSILAKEILREFDKIFQ